MAKKFTKKSTDDVEEPKIRSENSEDSENQSVSKSDNQSSEDQSLETETQGTEPEDEVEETEEAESVRQAQDKEARDSENSETQKVRKSEDQSSESKDSDDKEPETTVDSSSTSSEDDQEVVDPKQPHRTFNFRSKLGNFRSKKFIAVAAVLVAVVAGGLFFYNQNKLGSPGTLSAKESEKLIERVGKLIELPSEEPILATVSDVSQLSKEEFYQNAQNGDRVLVYKNSKMAILYRPSANKIIKVGTVLVDQPKAANATGSAVAGATDVNPSEAAEKSPTPTPGILRVAIYNGTKTAGLAKTTGDSLTEKYQNINVVTTGNASGDHTKNLIVDLSGENKSAASSLATELGGQVGDLPQGETSPSGADILIILGASQE